MTAPTLEEAQRNYQNALVGLKYSRDNELVPRDVIRTALMEYAVGQRLAAVKAAEATKETK